MPVLCLAMLCRVNENSDKEFMFIKAGAINDSIQMRIFPVPFNLMGVPVDVIQLIQWLYTKLGWSNQVQPKVETNYVTLVCSDPRAA